MLTTALFVLGLLGYILTFFDKEKHKKIWWGVTGVCIVLYAITFLMEKRDSNQEKEDAKNQNNILISQNFELKEQNDALIAKVDSMRVMLEPIQKLAESSYPDLSTRQAIAALSEDIATQKDQLEGLQNYLSVSELNIEGKTGRAGIALVERSSLISLLSKVLEKNGTDVNIKCTPEADAILRQVIKSNPRFPFSYYCIARCLKAKNDPTWKEYADKAVSIFRKTTVIDGHNTSHDNALKELSTLLVEDSLQTR